MTIKEMHVWFRQYAQQMGMQNVRAILPEQIDVLINTSISDTVNQVIAQNIGVTNDRIITDNSKIGQINALRSLYKVGTYLFEHDNGDDDPVLIEDKTNDAGLFSCSDFMTTDVLSDALFLVDLSLNYKRYSGSYDPADYDTLPVTAYYPIRIIDDAYLADTMQDFVLKPRVRTPIAVVYNNVLDVYLGEDYKKGNGLMSSDSIIPYLCRMSYVAKPNVVAYVSDIGGTNVDCNLPENMHVDILKHAVDLYNTSIQSGLYSAQQQQQQQTRETSRNNARPDNEGYQQ